MRENRSYGLEGGESGSSGLPYPYRATGGYGLPSGGLALGKTNSPTSAQLSSQI